jgi:DNA helicase-2/ATP-dependent DNA helicase PcrA
MDGLASDHLLEHLNPQQRLAAEHGEKPLLIVAGAGTGKTATLVHRVAWQIAQGIDPGRILLLTFTRRAAAEMSRRAERTIERAFGKPASPSMRPPITRLWAGTFHAIATRLLRRYGKAIGLAPDFAIHDRSDSEDLMHLVRTELHLAKSDKRFPQKGTCMAIYSRCVNARQPLPDALATHFPWCMDWTDELARLFDAYVDRKEQIGVLDYDDLLVYWHALLTADGAGDLVRRQFDRVLVDEYQDTNLLQAEILYALSPEGRGLTVVGDDAQAIYSFRAATVRNILDFPKHYPNASIVALEENYRSRPPILDATNAVIGQASERYAKNLWSRRSGGSRPVLVTCEEEEDQTDFVIRTILAHREAGIALRRQAVLFRASHHSILLEAELARRGIAFHKYGGLRFVETAHVKDLMAFLRLAENPRDVVSGNRILALLPGIGPHTTTRLMGRLAEAGDFAVWTEWKPPTAATRIWPKFVNLLADLHRTQAELTAQVHQVRLFYQPILEDRYDNPHPRTRDLEQLESLAAHYADRATMLAEITLDPPASTQDLAGPPALDDDYLVLSTIHSAKGLEWDAVYVIHASDGNLPSDMATGTREQVEEELRLFYVALTRARDWLYVCYPLRYYHYRGGDRFALAQRTRFLSKPVLKHFACQTASRQRTADRAALGDEVHPQVTSRSIRKSTKRYWS